MGTLTLTNLIPTLFEVVDIVAREQIGMIPAVGQDFSGERVPLGQSITSPVVGTMPAEDLLPAAASADTPNQTIGSVLMTISKQRSVPLGITGNEQQTLINGGILGRVSQDRLAQAFRTLSNEVEADLCALHSKMSRAYGTASGTPFATSGDLSDFAYPGKILTDNGAPLTNRRMVLSSSHITNIRAKQSTLFQVNTSGTDALLRRGAIGEVSGFDVGQTAGAVTSVAGTASGATTNAAGYAIGATVITLAAVGTGTMLAGDIVTFAGDTNQYILASGDTDVSNGGTITLAEPGLRVAMSAATKAITVIGATTRSMFFHRSALQLATRLPAMPLEGDSADDVIPFTDPVSGIVYELAVYKQKRQVRYELNLAWGVSAPMPRYSGLLIGA